MRPELSEVFQVLPSNALSKLRRLYQPGMASHEFQLTLGRFYGSTKYRDRVDSLHGADLKEFVDFLDNVWQIPSSSLSKSYIDSGFRPYGLRDWIKVYSSKRWTTYGVFAAITP